MGKLKRELAQDLDDLNEAYDYLAHSFDEMNKELLALKEELAVAKEQVSSSSLSNRVWQVT